MADGDHCRSIVFYEDPGIDNRRMVPAAHFEQRGDAFVPFFQDDNLNDLLEEAERPTEPHIENEELYLPSWPILPEEPTEEQPEFLLYDFDDTDDDSEDKSSDSEEYELSDDFDLEPNNDGDETAGGERENKQNSTEKGDESILGLSQKRRWERDGQLGEKSNGAFSHNDESNLEDFQRQPPVVEHSFKDREKWVDCREPEVKNSTADEDIQKNLFSLEFKKRTGEDCEEKDETDDGGRRYNSHDHDRILENL